MLKRSVVGVLLVLALSNCSSQADESDVVESADGVSSDGPLHALAGGGGITGPPVDVRSGEQTKTWTFGTLLCSDNPDADIEVDRVRYETIPSTLKQPIDDELKISTWFRILAPKIDDLVGAFDGEPTSLSGDVTEFNGKYRLPLEHECQGYFDERATWSQIELLTEVTVGSGGGVTTQTQIDYHIDTTAYTVTYDWRVGLCGTSLPAEFGCADRPDAHRQSR